MPEDTTDEERTDQIMVVGLDGADEPPVGNGHDGPNWLRAVAGLRMEASRTIEPEIRAALLTIASRLEGELIGDATEAKHLLVEAMAVAPAGFEANWEFALMQLRRGEPLSDVLSRLEKGMEEGGSPSYQWRLRDRIALTKSALSQTMPDFDGNTTQKDFLIRGPQGLPASRLGELWAAFQARIALDDDFTSCFRRAAKSFQVPAFKAAMFADLACGVHCGVYPTHPSVNPGDLIRQAMELEPSNTLYDILGVVICAGQPEAELELLCSRINQSPIEGIVRRAAALASFLGDPKRSVELLGRLDSTSVSPQTQWLWSKILDRAGETVQAAKIADELANRLTDPNDRAVLAMDVASHSRRAGNTPAYYEAIDMAHQYAKNLDTARFELERRYLIENDVQRLIELQSPDPFVLPTEELRRGEILETVAGDLKGALSSYRLEVDEDPFDPLRRRHVERVCQLGGDVVNWLEVCRQWTNLSDDQVAADSYQRLVAQLSGFEMGLPKVAVADYEDLLRRHSSDRDLRFELARWSLRAGSREPAERFLAELGEQDDVVGRLMWADILFSYESPTRTDDLVDQIQRFPSITSGQDFLITAYLLDDDREGLQEVLRSTGAETDRDTRLLAAHLAMEVGRPSEALDLLDTWVSVQPDDRAARDLHLQASLAVGNHQPVVEIGRAIDATAAIERARIGHQFQLWWSNNFSADHAGSVAEILGSPEDREIIWFATFVSLEDSSQRAHVASELLACRPENRLYRSIAEETVDSSHRIADRLGLHTSWVKNATPVDRDYLIHQIARSYVELNRPDDALKMWSKLLEFQPEHLPALVEQVRVLTGIGEFDDSEAVAVLVTESLAKGKTLSPSAVQDRLVEMVTEDELSDHLRALVAMELSSRAHSNDDLKDARRWAKKALSIKPEFEGAARFLIRLSDWPDAKKTTPKKIRQDAQVFAASFLWSEQPGLATEILQYANLETAAPFGVVDLLLHARHDEDPHTTRGAFSTWSDVGTDPTTSSFVDICLAEVCEGYCDDNDGAFSAYKRILTRDPTDVRAAIGLARLAGDEKIDAELLDTLVAVLKESVNGCDGLLRLSKQFPQDDRRRLLVEILRLDPSYVPAEWALLSLDWHLMPADLLAQRGRRRGCAWSLTRAAQREMGVGNTDNAILHCEEALQVGAVEECLATGGPLDVLSQLSELVGDPSIVSDPFDRLAHRVNSPTTRRRLFEMVLANKTGFAPSEATDCYLKCDDIVLDRALIQRSILRAASEEYWPFVIELLQTELGLDDPLVRPLQPMLWWEIGEIFRRYLGDHEAANGAFLEALSCDPCFSPAIVAIGRLFTVQGRWEEWIQHQTSFLEKETDPELAGRGYVNIAAVEEFQIGDPHRAFEHYILAMVSDPENISALLGVSRIAETVGRHESALMAYQGLAGFVSEKLGGAFLLRAAELAELHGQDVEMSLALYRDLNQSGFLDLTQPAVEACLAAQGKLDEFLAEYGRHADGGTQVTVNPVLVLRLLNASGIDEDGQAELATPSAWIASVFRKPEKLTISSVAKEAIQIVAGLDDATAAAEILRFVFLLQAFFGEPIDLGLVNQILLYDPADQLALLLTESSAKPGSAEEAEAIENRVRVAPEGHERAIALAAKAIHCAGVEDDDGLTEAVERLRQEVPSLPIAAHIQTALNSSEDDPESMSQRIEFEAYLEFDSLRRSQLWLEAARIRQKRMGQVERAVANLQLALRSDPKSDEVFEELKKLCVRQGDTVGLYDVLSRRALVVDDVRERVSVLSRMAELAYERLKDRKRAIWCRRQIIETDPTQVRSYRILAELLLTEGNPAEAAEMLEAVVVHCDQPSVLAKTRLDLARIYDEELGQAERAAEHLSAVVDKQKDDVVAIEGLARLSEEARDWQQAIAWLTRLVEKTPKRSRTAVLWLRLANALEQQEEKSERTDVAKVLFRALEVAPNDINAIDAFVEFIKRTERGEMVEQIVGQVAQCFADEVPGIDEDRALGLVFEIFERVGWKRRAYVASCVMKHIGHETNRSERRRIKEVHNPNWWESLEAIPIDATGAVFPSGIRSSLIKLLRAIDPVLSRVFPSRARLLGANRKSKLSHTQNHPASRLVSAFGRTDIDVYACLAPGSRPIVEPGSSGPVFVVPTDLLERPIDDSQIWILGVSLAPAVMGFGTLNRIPAESWLEILINAIRIRVPSYLRRESRFQENSEITERFKNSLNRKIIDEVKRPALELAQLDYDGLWKQRRLLELSATNLAAIGCQDVSKILQTVSAIKGEDIGRHMIGFLLTKSFNTLQRAMGIG